jgi:Kef-type K+ transport system membrane component KefB
MAFAMELPGVFAEVAAVLTLATVVGLVGLVLRQPLIVAFIVAGLVAGSGVINVESSVELIDVLAEVGIALLLFLVGLKLDFNLVRNLGRVALATGLGQIIFTTIFGWLIAVALGLEWLTALYVAIALTFSSTIIIVKLLSDKREVDSLHGRIAIGFLIVQDLGVVAAMVVLSAIGLGGEHGGELMTLLIGAPILIGVVALFMVYVAEPLMRRIGRSPELLITFGIAWAVLLAALGDWMGFGKELGGLIAGVSLASTSMREAIASRLAGLRDFLLLFFFVNLGMQLDLSTLGAQVPAATVLSVFVLVGNPLIVLAIMGYMGYRKRTGLLAGLTVSQISEFSLIFIAMGVTLGHVPDSAVGLVTLVGLVTITMSTYLITYSNKVYDLCEPFIRMFERKVAHAEESKEDQDELADKPYEVIVFGVGRYGGNIIKGLRDAGHRVLGVDFDPAAVKHWRDSGCDVIYGDAMDPEFVHTLPLAKARIVVMAFPARAYGVTHQDPRYVMQQALKDEGFSGHVVAVSDCEDEADNLKAHGITPVLMPFRDAAVRAVEVLEADLLANKGQG